MSNEGILWLLVDAGKARKQGERAIARRQRDRLAELVAIARTGSPYYRELYRDLPSRVDDVTSLPVTNKMSLMDRFDEWSTDRDVTLQMVRAFVDQPELIGERFFGKHTVATTSGTSGTRGIFLLDDRSMAVTGVLALRMLRSWLTAGGVRIIVGGGRLAMVNAMGSHFASAVAATRLRRRGGKRIQAFPIFVAIPTDLDVRLRLADGADNDRAWQTVQAVLTRLLAEHELGHVTIDCAAEPPVLSPGDKYRSVVPMN